MGGAVLEVEGLSKRYCRDLHRSLRYALRDIFGEALPAPTDTLRRDEFWALDDLSFTLGAGEALGVVGHNGAGKSTLLKLLYGLLKPDRGEIRLHGRTEALIELGAGFHPTLTGRENIDLAAAVSGLGTRDTRRLCERVVDFAELDEFIDAPLLSYSSGMRARLAFAIAVGLEPDLLLVDEVLAVGDPYFQRKCMNHMRGYLDGGGAVLFVSHNSHQIQALCDRGILLEHGRLAFAGSAVETVSRMLEERGEAERATDDRPDPYGPVIIERLSLTPVGGPDVQTGSDVRVDLSYRATEPVDTIWGFSILTRDRWVCVSGGSELEPTRLEAGNGELSCLVRGLPLVPGVYVMRASINEAANHVPLAGCGWSGPGLTFEVRAAPDMLTNAQVQLGQLVTLDIDWGRA